MYKTQFSAETQDLCEVYNDQISKLEQTVADMTRQREDTDAQYCTDSETLWHRRYGTVSLQRPVTI